jgi:hypothetical protein
VAEHGPQVLRGSHRFDPGILRSQDAAEGLRSFTERREADFTGH